MTATIFTFYLTERERMVCRKKRGTLRMEVEGCQRSVASFGMEA